MTEALYAEELEAAIETAKAAGNRLRNEFHRAGGPRGSGEHADADEEVERLIRTRLTTRFPMYGYLGEETGAAAGAEGVWAVDPNDGTGAFLRGWRGSSVSIALIRHGRPVLGVVYAYCAPDDGGDLFTWAEGHQVLRNGRVVERTWPSAPSGQLTALISHAGERRAREYAAMLHPLRFRALPGIAYRLALVAAGEGDAAISGTNPCSWDYAAGHALLIGAGGELHDSDGIPVRYDSQGRSSCGGRCLGASRPIVEWLRARDWAAIPRSAPPQEAPYGLCRPRAAPALPRTPLCRAQGCLLGQLAGDSLGGLVEFEMGKAIRAAYPDGVRRMEDGGTWGLLAGQPTDDSELALILARSAVAHGGYDAEAAAQAYAWWHGSRPFDMGNTTRQALSAAARAVQQGQAAAPAARAAANPASQANGALMRVSPLGILGAFVPLARVAEWARTDAQLTHPNPVCQEANVILATAIAYAISTGALAHELYRRALDSTIARLPGSEVGEVLLAAGREPPADYEGQAGWVLVALQNAFYQLLNAPDLEAGVVDTISRGGDTDTNAAIAGALLGAVHGRESVPAQWRDRVLTCRPVEGLEGVHRPRPEAFWPVDALLLAEQLLLAGL